MTASQPALQRPRRPLRLARNLKWVMVGMFVLLAALTPVLPDYVTYQAIYESGGGHLAALGRDLGFVLLVLLTQPFLGYDQFRWVVLAMLACLTLITLRNLQATFPRRLGLSTAFVLTPLIVLKFGAQIREGIALCAWLWIALGSARRPNPLLFGMIALISASIHAATAPLWAILGLALYIRPLWPRGAMLMATIVYGAFVYLVADVSRLEGDVFSGLSTDAVAPDYLTVLYWLIYPGVFAIALLTGEMRIRRRAIAPLPLRTLGFVLQASMSGFLAGLTLQIGLTGSAFFQKGIVSDSMRIAALVLALYCIFLAMRGKRRKACLLALFLSVDTIRIMLAA